MASSSGIVLLGKNATENSRVGNTILETEAFDSEAHSSSRRHSVRISGTVDERNISVINTYHLLQPDLSHDQITQRVRECVSLSAPGPHVILLVLQFNDFSDEDMRRVKTVLNLFSEKAIEHTIVVTTDEETRRSMWLVKGWSKPIHNLIKECGGRHLKFDSRDTGWRSEMIKRIDEMLKEEHEEFVICSMDEDGGSLVDEDLSRSGGSGSGGGVNTSGKAKLNIVLCGFNTALKNSVSEIFIGNPSKDSKEMIKVCVKKEEKINGRQITVIELPALSQLSEEEVMRETLHCLILCDPGVHVFILVIPVGSLTNEEKEEMEKIKGIFNSNEHFMVLFVTDITVDKSVSEFVTSTDSQRFVSLYGSWYNVMGLKEQRNSGQISKILDCIDHLKIEPYSLQTYMRVQEKRVKELEEKIKTMGVKLNLVVCGSDRRLKSFISNLILKQKEGSELSSECVRRDVELHGRLISVVELPALFNSQLSEEEVMRQTLRCVSLCDPGVHLFLLIIPDAPINDEDRAEIDKIQKIFSSRINKHIMILIKQNSEESTAELNEETQSVIESFGGRHHFIGPKTQASMLMEKLKQVVEENNDVCFSTETLWDAQMEKLLKLEVERQNYDKERKRRDEEFREREELYKRDIKEREEQERKMQEEMKREREEWEKQKQEERQRREEENEKKEETEQETWDEYYQRLKRGIERRQRERFFSPNMKKKEG